MKKFVFLTIAVAILTAAGFSTKYELPAPGGEFEPEQLFKLYCGPDVAQISTEIPKPNYDNELVKLAAHNLNQVAPVSFYLYSGIISNYGFERKTDKDFPWDSYAQVLQDPYNQQFGLKDGVFSEDLLRNKFDYEFVHKNPEYQAPAGVKGNTHAFLTYLCGEFRDRPTLIVEKLKWLADMVKLPALPQERIQPDKNLTKIWDKVTAESYAYYVTFSRAAFNAKEAATKTDVILGSYTVDKPVPAFTVCEVKYMFTEFISNGKLPFPGYEVYQAGLQEYQKSYCSRDDLDHYYDFRGDSNIKPNSPESNGMIWYATSIMNRCSRDQFGRVRLGSYRDQTTNEWKNVDFDLDICKKYMSAPFTNRWNAARAALATWLGRHQKFDGTFAQTSATVNIQPVFDPEYGPANFLLADGQVFSGRDAENLLPGMANGWTLADLGLNEIFGLGDGGFGQLDLAYERLKDAVDRHTDWYASGYDDSNFEPQRARIIGQAFSPFVASSYEMSESDMFTFPGITVTGPVDGRRQWMFVFKVHKDQWYNTDDLANGKPLNFETQWFDETSFGTTYLANTERAWDRLGTPLEGELESIVYLHNVINNRTRIKDVYNPEDYPPVADDQLGTTK